MTGTTETTETENLMWTQTYYALEDPSRWPDWPFLRLVRPDGDGNTVGGLAFDAVGCAGRFGYRSSAIPHPLSAPLPTPDQALALGREGYDSVPELIEGGWRVASLPLSAAKT